MTVETNANYISDFNKAYPRNRDLIKEGDDHIRLVKAVLQNTFPGMSGAVNPSSEKLNKLDATFTYEGSTLNIKNSITLAEGKDVDMGGAVIANVGDPVEGTDAVNLRSVQGSLMWPVGSIFMTVDSRNPREIFGFGTWEKFAQGRVIIGTGTTTDSNNELGTFVNEQKGGTYENTLTTDHLPAHTHKVDIESEGAGGHKHDNGLAMRTDGGQNLKFGGVATKGKLSYEHHQYNSDFSAWTDTASDHKHQVKGETEESGKGESFSNVQPYIGCNIWKRIADTDS